MRLEVLGPVALHGSDGSIPLPGHKGRQILTVLALAAPERVSSHRLIETLWADPPSSATKTLQAHMSRLRGALATAGATDAIAGGATGYLLDVGDALDLHELESLRRRAESARQGKDHGHAAALFGRARALWRGEPELPDTPNGEVLRRSLRDQQIRLAEAHLESLIEAGGANEAVSELGELVAAEPLNERLWELRILALYRSGRPTDALRAYGDVRTLLAEQIGVEPGPPLRRLEVAILGHEVAPVPTSSTSADPSRAPDLAYALAGDVHIAYRTYGDGDTPVLLLNPGLISIDTHLDEHHMARATTQLADARRVIVFDPRGIGLSDRTQPPESITIDDWVDDAAAVLDAASIPAAHVFASGHGALVAMALAHRFPQRVRSLTMVNAFARFTATEDYCHGFDAESFAGLQTRLQSTDPRPGVDALTLISPSVAADADYREWWNAAGRRAASPTAARALVTMMAGADLRDLVPSITAPTLLLIRRGCPIYDPGHGEYLAEHLPHATLEQHHDVNDAWWIGDTNFLLAAFARFLSRLSADDRPAARE